MDMKRFKGSDVERIVLEIPEVDEDTNETVYKEYYCDLTNLTTGAIDKLMPIVGEFVADLQKTAKGGEISEEVEGTAIDVVLKALSKNSEILVDVLTEVVTIKDKESGKEIEKIMLGDWLAGNVSPPSLLKLMDISISLTDLEMYGANFLQTQTQLTGMLMPKPVMKRSNPKTTPHPVRRQKH